MVGYSESPHPDMVDSWRCNSCDRLIYNTAIEDGQIVPRQGAPLPLWANKTFPSVCAVCYEMYSALDKIKSGYWRDSTSSKPLNSDNSFDVFLKCEAVKK